MEPPVLTNGAAGLQTGGQQLACEVGCVKSPSHVPADYPSMLDLSQTLRAVYRDLPATVQHADPALLSRPNPYEPGRADFPTAGDFVAFLISSHLAYHLGQLVAWCAAAGLGRVRAPAV